MRTVWAGILAGLAAAAGLHAAAAQDDEPGPAWLQDSTFSFVWENDVFGGTDSNYSNGVMLSLTTSPRDRPFLIPPLADAFADQPWMKGRKWRTTYAAGHSIFTPEDISAPNPDPNQRPYAGWAYVSGTVMAESPDKKTLDSAQLVVGLIGDGAGGEWVQSEFHQLINGVDPQGWRFQIKDEIAFTGRLERLRRAATRDIGPFEWDTFVNYGGALGTAETSVSFGGLVRVGDDLAADYGGPPRVRPAMSGANFFSGRGGWGWYVFAGLQGRAVAQDIFLDGNTFRDSRSVDRNWFVYDGQAGIAIRSGRARLAFTYVHRSEEFDTQTGPQRFGAGSISWRF
jgi:hypothetical protein